MPDETSATTAQRVLVLFAHPALERSRVNRVLIQGLDTLDGVTFRDLYQEYPDFDVDVEKEQGLLTEHDVVVMQHPFYWYSMPPLLKQWVDLVLEHGWAYGHDGTALHGKKLMGAITAGGRETAYREGGYNRYTIEELLRPVEQTARLCGMEFLSPFIVYGTHAMDPSDFGKHAARYREVLQALTRGEIAAAVEH
jgi:glutathione-regulated potassium-efflux system ancillary protein KefG